MLRVDEAVEVSVNKEGQPIGFRWRDECYLVTSHPVRWFARRDWWQESERAYRGIGAAVLETEMWQLTATCDEGVLQFELIHNVLGNLWKLVRVYS
jgi:hypothetical protein